jgi:hypothetical protein
MNTKIASIDYSRHYYAVRAIDGDKSSPVRMIMITEGYTFVSTGVYHGNEDMTPSCLSLIEKWEYDMLDGFGVDVITPTEYRHLMQRVQSISDHCRG